MSLNKELTLRPNPDLVKERANGSVDIEKLKKFFGKLLFGNEVKYNTILKLREEILNEIEPIDYNFFNLNRNERFDFAFKKSVEVLDFFSKHNVSDPALRSFLTGPILGSEKQLFTLQYTMVRNSLELWSTKEQQEYWLPKLANYSIVVTYAQTELGHGTYVRGLETTATFDQKTDEFILDSPTITSYKYWPGGMGKTCNYAIVMAKLIINGTDHGIQAFIIQLRSLDTHLPIPNIEIGDIGKKIGFNSQDNGYLAFHKLRIPRSHMLMNFAKVSRDGKFERIGNEILMYASMLLMRATLCMYAPLLLSLSLTISIRYSCVRHQTANLSGIEPPILDYQTQQYKLLTGLSTCYALYFSAINFRDSLTLIQKESNNLKDVSKLTLAQLHALSSALKAYGFDDCLKYSQISRLACGGHGYSLSSGLGQIILEADAACTYEGDNTVLYLQTARYLLKCAQNGQSPHFNSKSENYLSKSDLYLKYKHLIDHYHQLYDQVILEVGEQMLYNIKEQNKSEYEAWNNTSVLLVNASKCFINLFIIMSNLKYIQYYDENDSNKEVLIKMFEMYLLHGLCDTYSGQFLKHNIVNSKQIKDYQLQLFSILPFIRQNAILITDSFNWADSNLCSSLGSYDGNVYERLLDYARHSEFNKNTSIEQFEKYLKPFVQRQKSKL